jgi:hypothetical protein
MEDREPPVVAEQPLQFEEPVAPEVESEEEADEPEPKPLLTFEIAEPSAGGAPPWVKIPDGMKFPRRPIVFLRFASRYTDNPIKGFPLPVEDEGAVRIANPGGLWRQCICWSNDVGDITHAINRAKQDPLRLADELTRQMIRAVDGYRVDWSGSGAHPGSVEVFWNELGQRYRSMMNGVWNQLHSLSRDQKSDFFAHCVAVRSPG